MVREWRRGAYLITTDKGSLDLETIHGLLEKEGRTFGKFLRDDAEVGYYDGEG